LTFEDKLLLLKNLGNKERIELLNIVRRALIEVNAYYVRRQALVVLDYGDVKRIYDVEKLREKLLKIKEVLDE
jgi:hypothetical protein